MYDLAALESALAGTVFAGKVHFSPVTGSTNTDAMAAAREGAPHGSVFLADEQLAGRGRGDHMWHSTAGEGLYVSVVLRPRMAPAHLPIVPLAAGLAAANAILTASRLKVDLRWPNDLLIDGRKFCGILTEMHAEPDRIHYAVIGIGMNVNQAKMPSDLADIGTSLRIETHRIHSRFELLIRLLRSFDRYYNQFLADGATPILRRFAEVSTYFKGKRVRITTAGESFTGTTAGLEPSGVLRVRRDDGRGVVPVLSGDIAEAS